MPYFFAVVVCMTYYKGISFTKAKKDKKGAEIYICAFCVICDQLLTSPQNVYENEEWFQCLYKNLQDRIFHSGCAGYHCLIQNP